MARVTGAAGLSPGYDVGQNAEPSITTDGRMRVYTGGVEAAQVTTTTASIANGASLSGAVDSSAGRLARIDMPASWTAANLTFQISSDNATWLNLYDALGAEYTVQAAASRGLIVPLIDFLGARYIKIRSGTAAAAVNQGADRVLTLTLVP